MIKICIKENEFNPSLLQQGWCSEQKAIEMGYRIVEAPADCSADDFVELRFVQEKYNARKAREAEALNKEVRIAQIEDRLNKLSQDFIQVQLGAEIEDIEERKEEFRSLHNELRVLLGKEPREYA